MHTDIWVYLCTEKFSAVADPVERNDPSFIPDAGLRVRLEIMIGKGEEVSERKLVIAEARQGNGG